MAVSFSESAGVGLIEIDAPPVNKIGRSVREGLDRALDQAVASKLSRLIITGGGRIFAAGADAMEFDYPPEPPHLNDVLKRLVDIGIPTVAAINGPALGGGLEIALACSVRIASPDAILGLPEVTLGVVPGAGGTQRLPRLVGLRVAFDMILSGRSVSAQEAFNSGLLDAIADQPVAVAAGMEQPQIDLAVTADRRPAPNVDAVAENNAREKAARNPRFIAPRKAVELVAASVSTPIDEALSDERRVFLELRGSEQARALRHIFFAERAALAKAKEFGTPRHQISSSVVVGGGNMGTSIAYALASAGIATTVVEMSEASMTQASGKTARLVDEGVARAAISNTRANEIRTLLSHVVGFDSLPAADLAIEAVFEDMSVKQNVFARLQASLPNEAIIATNTSYLDVNLLADGVKSPERFVGLHFFSPAHVMKLLEVVRGSRTSAETLAAAFALAKRLGKIPVVAGVCDGFIGNRILARYRHMADLLLIEGALPEEVDGAMREFGMAMGPYEAQDLSGLDIGHANRVRQKLRQRSDIRYVPIADRMVEELARLGRKSGAGWYDYADTGRPIVSAVVSELVRQASHDASIVRRSFTSNEIVERIVLAMTVEALAILQEDIAERPADIDLVMVHGYGFPRWRGGLMHYASALPPGEMIVRVSELVAEDPLSWSVPLLLRQLADQGRSIACLNDA